MHTTKSDLHQTDASKFSIRGSRLCSRIEFVLNKITFFSSVDAISANHQVTACSLPDATLGHVQSNYAIHQTRNTAAQPHLPDRFEP